jgi:hypothetical protein
MQFTHDSWPEPRGRFRARFVQAEKIPIRTMTSARIGQ